MMSNTTMVVLIVALAMSVPIVRVISNAVLQWRKAQKIDAADLATSKRALDGLRQRVSALEAIVTDRGYVLDDEIRALGDAVVDRPVSSRSHASGASSRPSHGRSGARETDV